MFFELLNIWETEGQIFPRILDLLVGSSLLNKSWQQYTISFLDEQLGSQSMFVVDSIRG
jgi:hypothetical protein